MTRFLKKWLNAPFDTEQLKSGIQKENSSVCQMNNYYNSRIAVSMLVRHSGSSILCFFSSFLKGLDWLIFL